MGDRARSLTWGQWIPEPEGLTPEHRRLALYPVVQDVSLMLVHLLGLLRVPVETLRLPAAFLGGREHGHWTGASWGSHPHSVCVMGRVAQLLSPRCLVYTVENNGTPRLALLGGLSE